MRFIPAILIILILALFTFGIGAVYFATRLTPEVFQLNLETAKLKAEAERLKAEQALVETNVQAQIEIQNLHTDQEIKASWGYRYSLAFAKSFLNLWVVWVLLSVVGVLLNQRHRWTPQVVFVARGIKTMIPAKKAVELVREAMSIEELEVSQKMIAAEAEVSRDRFHDTMSAARMIKGLIPKESPIKPSEPIDITPAAIPAHVPSTFSMSDLLVDPDLERGHLPLGRNAASGGCVQVAPEFATSFDIVGKPNHCKTTILEMLTLGFLKLQDEGKLVDLYLIDPHAGFKGSLALFLQPVLHRFTKTVLGEQAIEEGQHLNLLQQFEQEAGKRQTHGYNEPLQVLIIDEIHDLLDQDGGKEAYMSLKKLRRLRKAGFFQCVVWHDSTKEGQANLGTGLMGLNVSAFVVNSTKSKAAKLLESEDADKAVNLEKGKAVLKLPGCESDLVALPVVRDADLYPFLSSRATPQPEPEHTEAAAVEKQDTFDLKALREQAGLSQVKLGDLVRKSQKEISRLETGENVICDELKQQLLRVLLKGNTSNVILFRKTV